MHKLDKEAVKHANPIDRVISELVGEAPTKVSATEVAVRCPFHEDSRPSLRINSSKNGGVWRCDPCDAGGDVFAFVEKHRGLDFKAKPIAKLAPELRATLEQYRAELLMLLRVCDEGVQERRAAFVCALAKGQKPGALLFRSGVPYGRGRCFSCGDPLDAAKFSKCWRCALAWRLAARLPIPVDLALAYDQQKLIA